LSQSLNQIPASSTILDCCFLVEDAFDQRHTEKLALYTNDPEFRAHSFAALVQLIHQGQFNKAILFGKELFFKSTNSMEKAVIHHWVTGCLEVQGFVVEREQWLKQWHFMDSSSHPWLRFIKKYQWAVGLYFDSHLRESIALFEQLVEEARQCGYHRGLEKCYFHIALIYKCLNQFEKSQNYLKLSASIANQRQSFRQLEKISEVEKSLSRSVWHLDSLLAETERLLLKREYRRARKLILYALRVRRVEQRDYSASSESMYLALVSLAFNRLSRFLNIYHNHISDKLIKEKTLSLAIDLQLPLPEDLTHELKLLRQTLGINSMFVDSDRSSSEFLGVKLNKVTDPEAIKVVQYLIKKEMGLTKEELCTTLWNYSYDPVVHDPRIYNLIYRVKSVFQCKDMIIAKGGFYRINPKYLNA